MGIIITHIRETYQPTSVMRRDRGILMAQLHNLRFTATTEYHGVSDWGFTKKHGGSAMADWSNVGHCHWLWIILSGGYLSIWINGGYLFPTIDWSNVFFFLSLEPYTGCSKRGAEDSMDGALNKTPASPTTTSWISKSWSVEERWAFVSGLSQLLAFFLVWKMKYIPNFRTWERCDS